VNRHHKVRYATLAASMVLVAVLVGAGYRFRQARIPPAPAPSSNAGMPAPGATGFGAYAVNGLATSADKVRIRAHFQGPPAADGSRMIAVRLLIAPGWHVNANPASFEYLIPTTLRAMVAAKPVRLEVRYPPGRTSAIRLQGKPLKVYENGTVLTARTPAPTLLAARADDGLVLDVTVQSCSDKGICLPPAELTTRLRPTS
jgi:hypothetical protein